MRTNSQVLLSLLKRKKSRIQFLRNSQLRILLQWRPRQPQSKQTPKRNCQTIHMHSLLTSQRNTRAKRRIHKNMTNPLLSISSSNLGSHRKQYKLMISLQRKTFQFLQRKRRPNPAIKLIKVKKKCSLISKTIPNQKYCPIVHLNL